MPTVETFAAMLAVGSSTLLGCQNPFYARAASHTMIVEPESGSGTIGLVALFASTSLTTSASQHAPPWAALGFAGTARAFHVTPPPPPPPVTTTVGTHAIAGGISSVGYVPRHPPHVRGAIRRVRP